GFEWRLERGAGDWGAWTVRGALDAASKEANEPLSAAFVRKFYDRVAPGIYGEFDGPALLPLIAPRPLLVVTGDSDPRTPLAGVRECMTAAQRAYREAGARDRLGLHLQQDAGHEGTAQAGAARAAWVLWG